MLLLSRLPLLLALAATALPVAAQLPPLVDREVFFGDPEISGAQVSPDGQYLTFRKPFATASGDEVMNVWVKGIDEPFDAARPLTADERPVPGYFWSEDGRYVLYVQDKGGDENYHVWAVNPSAKADPATGVPTARDLTPLDGVRAQILATPENSPNEIVVGLNDRDASWHDIYRINLETGERDLLIENTERIAGWQTDLNGNVRLALRTTSDGSTEILRIADDLSIDPDPVYTCTVEEACGPDRYHKDGRRVYMQTNKGERDLVELVLFDPATGQEELVERDPEGQVDFGGTLFSSEDELELTYYVGDRVRLYPKTDEMKADLAFLRANLPEGELYPGSRTNDDRLMVVSVTRDVDPGSVYLFNREAQTVEKLYTSRPELPVEHMAPMQAIRYPARDGLEIPAYLTVPKGVEAKNLPAIIFPHGGPWARDTYGYDSFAQFLANRGYVVLQPNFRGSTGYGKAFLNAGNKEWGTGAMQHDLTDGVQYLIDQGIADPERVGIMGGSYGGYATLAGVTFTPDLYAVAVSIVGPSSLITLLESIPPYWEAGRVIFHERMGNPETDEGRAQLDAQSPLNFADRITTPLLVIQGANDPRVKQRESDQIVVALRDRDYPVEYLVAPDEGHGFRGEENRMAMTVSIESFLAEHLGGRAQRGAAPEIEAKLRDITVDPATVVVTDPMGAADLDDLPFDGGKVTSATMRYDITMDVQGQEVDLENATRTVTAVTHSGEPALAIVDRATLPPMMGGIALVDSFVVSQGDFAPRYREMRQGPGTIVLTYADGEIQGEMSQGGQGMPFTSALDRPILADGAALDVGLGTLPLSEGYSASFATYNPVPGQQGLATYTMTVTGTEAVTVPAGTYQTWVIALDNADSNEDRTLYLDRETGTTVKAVATLPAQMGGGTVTTELSGMQ